MKFFGTKDKIPEEEDYTISTGRKITKDLKDLKPENKKKRKEPPKPWGKRERFIVLAVLLATTIISAILLFGDLLKSDLGKINFNLPKIDLSSINIFKGETIEIRKK